ncbi:hypothetical protein UY3_17211 [Chelonia mydas]|uniref:Uncharacterized protein n=1 Tax=Chelonia mydas TaxID=8469 RepID=M7B0V9_CHEMY|nr:hypothetical protein UY3_17211 [Chelonia mydas]
MKAVQRPVGNPVERGLGRGTVAEERVVVLKRLRRASKRNCGLGELQMPGVQSTNGGDRYNDVIVREGGMRCISATALISLRDTLARTHLPRQCLCAVLGTPALVHVHLFPFTVLSEGAGDKEDAGEPLSPVESGLCSLLASGTASALAAAAAGFGGDISALAAAAADLVASSAEGCAWNRNRGQCVRCVTFFPSVCSLAFALRGALAGKIEPIALTGSDRWMPGAPCSRRLHCELGVRLERRGVCFMAHLPLEFFFLVVDNQGITLHFSRKDAACFSQAGYRALTSLPSGCRAAAALLFVNQRSPI